MRAEAYMNRRTTMAAMLAAGAATLGIKAFAAAPGKLSDADYTKLSAAPKNAADHRTLAKHYRAWADEHEAEAKMLDNLATIYMKGMPGVTQGHAHELARTVKHAAEHSRDFAEALRDIADVHDGIAEGPVK